MKAKGVLNRLKSHKKSPKSHDHSVWFLGPDEVLGCLFQPPFGSYQQVVIGSSLQFYGMIILVKTKPLCRGMARLPIQKLRPFQMGVETFHLANF